MDTIFIRDFRLHIKVGLYDWERVAPQTVQLDLEIGITGAHASQSDALADTIDYAQVVRRLEAALQDNKIQLLEKLAEQVAAIIMGEFNAPWVKVGITKLAALKNVKQVGVTIERGSKTL
ncbi:MAG: dihydroneopterin aldolase [Betaproteobacteria bacterium]|nr:dihydroneopterin aldolase [Betaproteobacteria bacterium]